MMKHKSIRRLLVVGLLTISVLTGFASAAPASAEAHTFQRGICWINTQKQPNGERFQYLQRCRAYVRAHIVAHTRIRFAAICSRMTSGASYYECYLLGLSQMPLGWTVDPAYHRLISHESGWNPRARNPSSGACGLHQFLPCRAYGDVKAQGSAGYRYIKQRYGSPAGAWAFWTRNHWY